MGPRALVLREAYHPPFWRIERTHERWRFDVALSPYDPDAVDPGPARPWARRWRGRLGVGRTAREGFVLIPLQGRLLAHRSFQCMSPVAMIEAALSRDPRPHVATLHPRERYGADEVAALDALARRFPRFSWRVGGTDALLGTCDHVVTMNSAVAFDGFWGAKRAVLFGLIDFHHVAGSVPRDGLDDAFATLDAPEPDWDRYLWWFWQGHCLNMGAPDAEARIRARLVAHGMPL